MGRSSDACGKSGRGGGGAARVMDPSTGTTVTDVVGFASLLGLGTLVLL